MDKRALIVEDESAVANFIKRVLELAGYTHTVHTKLASDAITHFSTKTFDLVVADHGLPDAGGDVLIQNIRALDSDVAIIVISGKIDHDVGALALAAGANDYLAKPFSLKQLHTTVLAATRS